MTHYIFHTNVANHPLSLTDGDTLYTYPNVTYDQSHGRIFAAGDVSVGISGTLTGAPTGIECNGSLTMGLGTAASVQGSDVGIFDALFKNDHADIENHGTIAGGTNAIDVSASSPGNGSVIKNYGYISSGSGIINRGPVEQGAAILTTTFYGDLTSQVYNYGIIESSSKVNVSLFSLGKVTDTVVNSGLMIGDVLLGDMDDTFDNGDGKVVGDIDGGNGNDTIIGGAKVDVMTGGLGRDTFYFYAKPNAKAVDHITDFHHGADKIALSETTFTLDPHEHLSHAFRDITDGLSRQDADDHILYNHQTGYLYYDADGKGGHAPVHFATLDHHPSLTYADFLTA